MHSSIAGLHFTWFSICTFIHRSRLCLLQYIIHTRQSSDQEQRPQNTTPTSSIFCSPMLKILFAFFYVHFTFKLCPLATKFCCALHDYSILLLLLSCLLRRRRSAPELPTRLTGADFEMVLETVCLLAQTEAADNKVLHMYTQELHSVFG